MARKILKRIVAGVGLILALIVVLFTAGVLWPLDIPAPAARDDRLLITKIALVDVETGEIRAGQDILVADGEITTVGPDLAGAGARIVDGEGLYAIPGLFDMHVHSIKMSPALTHPIFIAAGVTSVRDMGGCIGIPDGWVACADEKRQWNAAVRDGSIVGPRFDAITSLAINGGREIPDGLDKALGAPDAAGGEARVAYDKARGLDFLKPYTRLPREGYFALAEAARANDMYLAGHLPMAISALEAVAAGQRSIEHAFLFIWDCYPDMAAIRASGDPRLAYSDENRRAMLERHDAAACAALHERMVAAGTAYVPTHTTRKLDAYATDATYRNDPRLKYIPAPLRYLWLEDANGMAARAGADGVAGYRDFYEFGLQQTGVAYRAGVAILAGTDAPDSFAFPGSGLHDELDHFVTAGMSPLATLQAATLHPAAFLGLEGKAGVLKEGARADIVLLRADPLSDIKAVREIEAVVLAGSYYDRDQLDGLLAGVEEAASGWSMWPKFIWQILTSPIMRKQFAD